MQSSLRHTKGTRAQHPGLWFISVYPAQEDHDPAVSLTEPYQKLTLPGSQMSAYVSRRFQIHLRVKKGNLERVLSLVTQSDP